MNDDSIPLTPEHNTTPDMRPDADLHNRLAEVENKVFYLEQEVRELRKRY